METLQFILNLNELEKRQLNINGIKSSNSFTECDERKLQEILGVDLEKVLDMKAKLNKIFKLEVKQGSELLQEYCLHGEKFVTLIESIDEILPANGVLSGEIIEITGPPCSGKSMLLNTIMINILEHSEDLTIMYIDTKYDFSAIKLKKMMEKRKIENAKQIQILKRIRVERIRTPEELIKILQYILDTPKIHDKLKLIMIDSITVPFYLYFGHTLFRLNLMTQATELMKALGKQHVSILVTNLANHQVTTETITSSQRSSRSYNSSSGSNASGSQRTTKVTIKPALGQYWEAIAHHKVLIDFLDYPHNFTAETGERQVSLFTSKTAAPSESKLVKITEFGVI